MHLSTGKFCGAFRLIFYRECREKAAVTALWGRRWKPRDVLFWWQKRTRKPPAISTRWIHEKGAARPFQTPKGKSKWKNASRFAKTGCGSQRLLRCRSHPAGRGPNSSSLFPPLAAVVVVAPTEERLWHSATFSMMTMISPETQSSLPKAPLPGELSSGCETERLDKGRL